MPSTNKPDSFGATGRTIAETHNQTEGQRDDITLILSFTGQDKRTTLGTQCRYSRVLKFEVFDGETHGSAVGQAISRGLRAVFS